MYRQIKLHPADWDLQRIVWRSTTSDPIQHYHLTTVTYGTTSAPYLAIRTLHQLADDEAHRYSLGSRIIKEDFYVDDVLSGSHDVETALHRQKELLQLLRAGGFSLRKWTSNSPHLLSHLSPELVAKTSDISWQSEPLFHMLGLTWQCLDDCFMFNLQINLESAFITKRSVLSKIAQLFDPLGLLSPITVVAKIFMQSLWLLKLDWNSPLPEAESRTWSKYFSSLQDLPRLRIPRWLHLCPTLQFVELHGFADASERAYAAAIYIKTCTRHGSVHLSLLCSKTKVAPIKQVSLPRLELCAATLLVRLMVHTRDLLSLKDSPIHLWSDSTVTLTWLSSHPTKWKTYVANRVSEIQSSLPSAYWHHIPSSENPADCASRGITVSEIISHQLWWHGPSFLRQSVEQWPTTNFNPQHTDVLEQKVVAHATNIQLPRVWDLLYRFSTLKNLLRVTAWCHRFIRLLHARVTRSPSLDLPSILTPEEIDQARYLWIRLIQQTSFVEETKFLTKNTALHKGPLKRLNPFLDDEGLLRVGGRLKHAILDHDEKHPLILPHDSPFTRLLISETHRKLLHGGTQLTLCSLRRKYWILRGRSAVKTCIYQCLTCLRHRAVTAQQQMGSLPKERITPARPFYNCGVDYAGPILLRTTKGRGHKSYKGYIVIFVCFATRAVHIEAVSDYTTDTFLAAFKRFTSRRGICATISSDCGTNLIGADVELRRLFTAATEEFKFIANSLANDGIRWKFNPPAAPHFGGLWEAAVKSTKHHLKRVIGETTLTYEELSTLLTQIEACLNSRPLQPLSDDPDDYAALTPGHFLIGSALTAIPDPSLRELTISRLSRWQLIQQMHNQFWLRWSSEYLHSLQSRTKWFTQQPPVKIGDLALLKVDTMPPTKWALARVTDVHPGTDGQIRVMIVKTSTSTFRRPITKLCLLPHAPSTDTEST